MSETVPVKGSRLDEFDVTVIFAVLWRRRKLILFGTLAATLLAAALSFFIPKTYRSEGFYQLGHPEKKEARKKGARNGEAGSSGIPIPQYKKSAPQFFNPDHLNRSAREGNLFSSRDLKWLREKFRTAEDRDRWVLPVYAYAKEDTRQFAQLPKDAANSVLGVKLSFEADSPQLASGVVRFIGRHVRDCFMQEALHDYIKDEYSRVISELNRNENIIFDLQFQMRQNKIKLLDIKAILTKYPQAAGMESRQLVSVLAGGARFLGPVTQLVGIESALADQRQELAGLQREKEKLLIRRDYFSKCNGALNQSSWNGEKLFAQLKTIRSDVFGNKDFHHDTLRTVFNDVNIDLQAFDLAFLTDCRFVSGPTFPARPNNPSKRNITILAGFLSFVLLVLFVLARHWWQGNENKVKSLK